MSAGLLFRTLPLALVALAITGPLTACGGRSYPAGLDDSDYDLEAMALRESDLPEGYKEQQHGEFNNEEFAVLFPVEDTDAKKRQLDAQGRVRSYVAIFSWDDPIQHFGRPLTFTVQSTLYVDVAAAKESLQSTCGLLVDDAVQVDEIFVPKLADDGVGFSYSQTQDVVGEAVETDICFRTGRIVHAIAQSGLEGTQDIGQSVRLAERMLERVDATFDELQEQS